jgi:hypothetical protein
MNLLNRSELKYAYNWRPIPDDDPRISGSPDKTLFTRKEGYEVLYIINVFADRYSLKEIETGHKIEELIQKELPGNFRCQLHVIEWLEENIEKIKYEGDIKIFGDKQNSKQ